MMKLLIGAACLVVVASGGVYLTKTVNDWREEQAQEERVEGARAELFRFAEAKPGEESKVRHWCERAEAHTPSPSVEKEWRGLLRNCRAFGYL